MREWITGQNCARNRGTVSSLEPSAVEIADIQFAEALHDCADALVTVNPDVAIRLYQIADFARATVHESQQARQRSLLSPPGQPRSPAFVLGRYCATLLPHLLQLF